MKTIISTSLSEVKSSLENLKSAFSNSFQQLVDKGKELQQVTESLLTRTVSRDFPRCDLVEGSNELFVLFELPGLSLEDFQLEIGGELLVVKGEKKSKIQGRGAAIHLGECAYGAFERSVSLPLRVVEEKAEAELASGILLITIPKAEVSDQPRRKVPVR